MRPRVIDIAALAKQYPTIDVVAAKAATLKGAAMASAPAVTSPRQLSSKQQYTTIDVARLANPRVSGQKDSPTDCGCGGGCGDDVKGRDRVRSTLAYPVDRKTQQRLREASHRTAPRLLGFQPAKRRSVGKLGRVQTIGGDRGCLNPSCTSRPASAAEWECLLNAMRETLALDIYAEYRLRTGFYRGVEAVEAAAIRWLGPDQKQPDRASSRNPDERWRSARRVRE